MFYNIGEKVKLKKDLNINTIYGNNGIRYTKEMDKYKDKPLKILAIKIDDECYYVDKKFYINDEMIDCVYTTNTKVKIFYHKNYCYVPSFEAVINKFLKDVNYKDIRTTEDFTIIVYEEK